MELRQLRYLAAIARHGGFTRAAEALQLAQPALSQQIRRLEDELGVELLTRTQRGAHPTDAGSVVLRRLARIEAELEGLTGDLAQVKDALRGEVRLGVTFMPPEFGLAQLLAAFRAERPGIDVLLRAGTAATMERLLHAGELDLAFVTTPRAGHGAGIESSGPLCEEELAALIAREHPLASAPERSLAELAREPIIAAEPGSVMRDLVDHAFASAGLANDVPFETDDPEMIRLLAASHMGVAIMPRSMLGPSDPDLCAVSIHTPRITRTIALTWAAAGEPSPAATAFRLFAISRCHKPPL